MKLILNKNPSPYVLKIVKFTSLAPLFALFTLAFTSCSSTVTSRIEKNPALYNNLNTKHKALVDKGQITTGMNKEAVFLAWGNPADIGKGESSSKGRFERWTYNSYQPVYSHSISGYYGSSHSRYRPRSPYGYYPGINSHVRYVPYRNAQVDFKNGRVIDWKKGNTNGLY